MKYWLIGIGLLVPAAVICLLLRRHKRSPDPQIDGGVRTFEDSNAPKVIRSTRITGFRCDFSTYDRMVEDSPIAGYRITLQVGSDSGSYSMCRGSEVCREGSFTPGEAFLEKLQQLVAAYDMARYNGKHYRVSGLPPDYGMALEICYASGESIRSSNNQSCFLPLQAMEALVALFQQQ